MKQTGISTIWI